MTPRTPSSEYRLRADRGLERISREMERAGHPKPLGDPLYGIVVLLAQPVGPRVLGAMSLSLGALQLQNSYVTFAATGLLARELRLTEPRILVASGSGAASEIDELQNPLTTGEFSTATPGKPFVWKRNTTGLLLPQLSEALDDEARKREFWTAFLSLKTLT